MDCVLRPAHPLQPEEDAIVRGLGMIAAVATGQTSTDRASRYDKVLSIACPSFNFVQLCTTSTSQASL